MRALSLIRNCSCRWYAAGAVWKKYNSDTRETMVIEKDKWKCVSDPSKPARELLEKAYGDNPYHIW